MKMDDDLVRDFGIVVISLRPINKIYFSIRNDNNKHRNLSRFFKFIYILP